MAQSAIFGANQVHVGHSYVIALAPGIYANAIVTFQRMHGRTRFVRFESPRLKKPGYCRASDFAKAVRTARRGE